MSGSVTSNTQGFTQLVNSQAAVVQTGAAPRAGLDLSTGSVLRAMLEAFASVGLWLQGLILQVMTMARLSTSTGADVDSFVAQFGLTRVAATSATGSVTFGRFVPTLAAVVSPGATVATSDGSQSYTVIADPTQPTWNSGSGAYLIGATVATATVTVQAVTPGLAGNAAAGTITLLSTSISGIDYVTNAAALAGGSNAETDAALKIRFAAFFASLSRATPAAIRYAISTVQAGLLTSVVENQDPSGNPVPASFYTVVDDGSGSPPGALITAVGNAIEGYRALGVSHYEYAPTAVTATIAATITVASGYTASAVQSSVVAALTALANGGGPAVNLQYAKLSAAIFTVPGVTGASGITLNGATADLAVSGLQEVRAGTVTVTVSS